MYKISLYTPDIIPAAISVASEKSVSTLTTPSDSPRLLSLPSYDPKPTHSMKKYEPYRGWNQPISYYINSPIFGLQSLLPTV